LLVTDSDDRRDDLRAALAARQELGSGFEPEIIDSFLERLERTIEARVDARISERLAASAPPAPEKKSTAAEGVFASMLGGTLASGVIGATMHSDGAPVVALVWIVIMVINIAHALAGRQRR
jgi:hypothetical protein